MTVYFFNNVMQSITEESIELGSQREKVVDINVYSIQIDAGRSFSKNGIFIFLEGIFQV